MATIAAAREAKAALTRIRAEHGDIMLHLTGGWCARTPLVPLRNDLKLGSRDVLLGSVDGVPIYKMVTSIGEEEAQGFADSVLDLVEGLTMGFPIEAAPGQHFMLCDAG